MGAFASFDQSVREFKSRPLHKNMLMKMKPRIMPPTYFITFLVLLVCSHFIFPVKKIIFPPHNYVGIVLILFGVIINVWADALFKKNEINVKPHEVPVKLLVSGPFRMSRHPMYLGMTSILLGVAILLGSLVTFIFPMIFVVVMEIVFIPLEEKNLEKNFGEKYLAYKKKVRRWI